MSLRDICFTGVIVVLMLLFYGEPDLFDAIREALIARLK